MSTSRYGAFTGSPEIIDPIIDAYENRWMPYYEALYTPFQNDAESIHEAKSCAALDFVQNMRTWADGYRGMFSLLQAIFASPQSELRMSQIVNLHDYGKFLVDLKYIQDTVFFTIEMKKKQTNWDPFIIGKVVSLAGGHKYFRSKPLDEHDRLRRKHLDEKIHRSVLSVTVKAAAQEEEAGSLAKLKHELEQVIRAYACFDVEMRLEMSMQNRSKNEKYDAEYTVQFRKSRRVGPMKSDTSLCYPKQDSRKLDDYFN